MKRVDTPIFRLPVVFALTLLLTSCASHTRQIQLHDPLAGEIGSDVDPQQQVRNLGFEELLARGAEHAAQGNFELSAFHYRQALTREPESLPAFLGLGKLFWQQGRFDAAAKVYRRALEIDPDHVPALLGAGRAHRMLGQVGQSEQALQQAIARQPDNLEVMTELAVTYDHTGRHNLAEPLFLQVVDGRPGEAGPLNNLGFNLLLQRRYDDAVTPLRQALELMPRGRHIQNNLAVAYLMSDQAVKAKRLFKQTVGIAGAWNNIGYIHLTRGEWDRAERAFERALDLDPVFYARAKENLQRVQEMRETAEGGH